MANAGNLSIEAYIERAPLALQGRLRAAVRLVRAAAPEAVERVIPGWNIIAYSNTAIFCYLHVSKGQVKLGLNYGVFLPDPHGLLEASSAQYARNTVIGEEPDEAGLSGLVQAAFAYDITRRMYR